MIRTTIIEEQTKEWFAARQNTIGASEIGVVLRESDYKWIGELYYEKIGMNKSSFNGNKFTYWGRHMEQIIADAWEYWELSDDESYVKNRAIGKKIRKCRNHRGMTINDKWPHLSASLDRVIQKGELNIITGDPVTKPCPIEIKTIMVHAMKKWESDVPFVYLLQITQQMLVTETEYAEIAMLDSERNLHVHPAEFRQGIADAIISKSSEFWERVSRGKGLMEEKGIADLHGDLKLSDEIQHEIDMLCPEVADGEEQLYKKFLKEKYTDANILSVTGGEEHYDIGYEIKILESYLKSFEAQIEKRKNHIKAFMCDAQECLFKDRYDKFTWRKDSRGARKFLTGFKPDLDRDDILENVKNIVSEIIDKNYIK